MSVVLCRNGPFACLGVRFHSFLHAKGSVFFPLLVFFPILQQPCPWQSAALTFFVRVVYTDNGSPILFLFKEQPLKIAPRQ